MAKPDGEQSVIFRLPKILFVCGKYFVWHKFTKNRKAILGLRIRLACEELGPVFIKFGQLLSTRYELISREDSEELGALLDKVSPMPEETMRRIFLSDFKKAPEEIFAKFDKTPIASASIAQVYVAYIKNGEKVAVKIRRPNIHKTIKSDLAIIKFITKLAQLFSSDLRHVKIDVVIAQIEDWMFKETDFSLEAENLLTVKDYVRRMKAGKNPYAHAIVTPKFHPEYSSANVITMEFIEGVPMNKLEAIKGNKEYDPVSSMRSFMNGVLYDWMHESDFYFHGDPHPANVLILPNGKLGLLDYGLLGHFEGKDCQETKDLFLAVYAQNTEEAVKVALKMCGADLKYRSVIREDVKNYIEQAEFTGLGFWFTGFVKIFVKHRMPLPYQLVLFARMHALMENLAHIVMPGATTVEMIGEELERGLRKRILDNILNVKLFPVIYAISEKIKNSPDQAAKLVDRYFDNPMQLVKDFKEAIRV